MKAFHTDRFPLPLPPGHRFPLAKYAALRERVAAELPEVDLREPPAASDAQLGLVHERDFLRRVVAGELTAAEQRAIGLPWSEQMVERSRRSVGATIAAFSAAMAEGISVSLAGGTHHAHRDRGLGYCVFNDVAVAAALLLRDDERARVAIVDLDVHQGDGTAAIFAGSRMVFTLSLHGEKNYPTRKVGGHLDVGLPDGTDDARYLDALDAALATMQARFEPTFIAYLAGADPHEADRLGRLRLTFDGLRARDARVLELARRLRAPVAVTMAGGYGHDIGTTVQVHLNTVAAALRHWQRGRAWQHVEDGRD